MDFSKIVKTEWKPALGCTEPASIAYAASLAASQVEGEVKGVFLRCDPGMFKNCFAVGIPNSDGKTGILWALSIGCLLPDPSLELECFKQNNAGIIGAAGKLLESDAVHVEALFAENHLYVDCKVVKTGGVGRAIIEDNHTNVTVIEKDGVFVRKGKKEADPAKEVPIRSELKSLSFHQIIEISRSLTEEDRALLQKGIAHNLGICELGKKLFQDGIPEVAPDDNIGQICQTVFAGVYARMSGANHLVMAAAGSGNKGITCSVPLVLSGRHRKLKERKIEEALALALIINSLTTHHLGTLSAICGCSNAAGIGLAAGLTYLNGGGEKEISSAISNMVGNISGIICDGAKIGCATKSMTAVDAAFRASAFALRGIFIPATDGIVGADGMKSLEHLGRIASRGMSGMDNEILQIMRSKLHFS